MSPQRNARRRVHLGAARRAAAHRARRAPRGTSTSTAGGAGSAARAARRSSGRTRRNRRSPSRPARSTRPTGLATETPHLRRATPRTGRIRRARPSSIAAVRIDVLNGVNLDMLGRRDPTQYGYGSLQDLETQVYAWARELALQVRCRQTNHEGEYVEFLHAALDNADALVVNPGSWTHYSWAIRDALEPFAGRSSRCTSPTSTPARSGAVTACSRAWRRSGSPDRESTATARRSSCSRNGGTHESDRAARGDARRRRCSSPGSSTCRYLTGFESSNAALLVDPAGDATLYTDFRYADAARAIDGRDVRADAAERRHGARRSGSRAAGSPSRRGTSRSPTPTRSAPAASSSCRRHGLVESLARGQGRRASSTRSAARPRSPTGSTRSSAAQRFVGRTEAELAWWLEQAWHEAGPTARRSTRSSRSARTARGRTRSSRDEPIPEGTLVVVDAGCAVDGYRSDCTRTFFTGEPEGRLAGAVRPVPHGTARRARRGRPGAVGRDVDAASRARDRGGGDGRAVRARARSRRRARRPRGAEHAAGVRRCPRARERRHGRAGASTCPATSASGSRTWSSSPRTGASGSRPSRRSPVLVG